MLRRARDLTPLPLAIVRASGAQNGGAGDRRRRRRRRVLIASPPVGLLLWLGISYGIWMLQPTSLSWNIRSVEWVRADVPFGNWIVDHIEQIYYTANADRKSVV